ncbi:MAG: hypothetical protein AAF629_10420 [Chloroflexota bacterium]
MEKELVLFSSATYSPFVALARDLLKRYQIPFREIKTDGNEQAQTQLKAWFTEVRVPTIALCQPGKTVLVDSPQSFVNNPPHRGEDRGSLIVEPNNHQLEDWLHKHGFLAKPYKR